MAGEEMTEARENSTADKAASNGGSPSAPDSPINLQRVGTGRQRPDAPTQALTPRPTPKIAAPGQADEYALSGEALEIPSVHTFQNLSRSVRSTAPNAAGTASASAPGPSSGDDAQVPRLKKTVLMLSLAVALLGVTTAVLAYKLYSRPGPETTGALAQDADDPARPASTVRPGAAHPKPLLPGVKTPPPAEPEPELPPSVALPVAEVQEWDPARFAKAKVVEAKCSFSGKLVTFRTPGCTSFVKFPADALPASLTQAPGQTPDIFQFTRAKVLPNGDREPVLNCTMHGGTDIQVRTSKRNGSEEDLLRHSATVLAVARLGDDEILYVCGAPEKACPALLMSLSAIPDGLMVVPDLGGGSRNPMVVVPHANPGSLVVKYRKSPKEAWSNLGPAPADLAIPRLGKVTFKLAGGSASRGLVVSTEPDEEFSDQARKCGSVPIAASGDKAAPPEQQQILEICKIAEGCSIRIEDAAGRKLASFRLVPAVPRSLTQD